MNEHRLGTVLGFALAAEAALALALDTYREYVAALGLEGENVEDLAQQATRALDNAAKHHAEAMKELKAGA